MPSKVAMPIEAPALVAVTGANGFIAQHCIAALLEKGYRVVGTVRSDAKVEAVRQAHGGGGAAQHPKLSVVVVADITDPDQYRAALEPLSPTAVLHLASPFHYRATDFERELMVPAVRGATALLEACAAMRSVKRVVHTNSFACIYDAAAGLQPAKTYTARDWSPLTYADGVSAPDAATAYRACKTAAERAAWRFVAANDKKSRAAAVGFDLVSLCPAMVFGPFLPKAKPRSIAEVNTSNLLVWAVAGAEGRHAAVPPTKGPVWVDVRDVADAHVRALAVPEAGGRRFLLAQGVYCNQELADVARKVLPPAHQARIPLGKPGAREAHTHFGVDATETERVLGVSWRGLDDCLRDLVPQLYEIEAQQNKG